MGQEGWPSAVFTCIQLVCKVVVQVLSEFLALVKANSTDFTLELKRLKQLGLSDCVWSILVSKLVNLQS